MKSSNYWISIQQKEFQGNQVWGWCIYHSMTDDPILVSKLYAVESEAIRLAEKFSEESGIRFARPPKAARSFTLIQGGEGGSST